MPARPGRPIAGRNLQAWPRAQRGGFLAAIAAFSPALESSMPVFGPRSGSFATKTAAIGGCSQGTQGPSRIEIVAQKRSEGRDSRCHRAKFWRKPVDPGESRLMVIRRMPAQATTSLHETYVGRRPQDYVLYRVVAAELEGFLAEA